MLLRALSLWGLKLGWHSVISVGLGQPRRQEWEGEQVKKWKGKWILLWWWGEPMVSICTATYPRGSPLSPHCPRLLEVRCGRPARSLLGKTLSLFSELRFSLTRNAIIIAPTQSQEGSIASVL